MSLPNRGLDKLPRHVFVYVVTNISSRLYFPGFNVLYLPVIGRIL